MIDYNEDWLFLLLFKLKGSVYLRSSCFALPCSILACLLVQVHRWYPEFRHHSGLEGVEKSQIWSASIFIVSILITFRTNRAMARFWEGTGLLHQMRGEWFDAVSCLVAFSSTAKFEKPEEVRDFRHTVVRLMSVCHGSALGEIANINSDQVETIDPFGLSNATLSQLKRCTELKFNRVEVLLHMIQTLTTKALSDGILHIPPPILSRVYQTLSRGFVNLLNSKKIADTRFPFPYVQLIALLMLLNWCVIPILVSTLLDNLFLAFMFTFIPVFGIFSLNYIGIELENPFGDDENDLPLGHFQKEMNNCLLMLLEDHADLLPSLSAKRAKKSFEQLHNDMQGSCRSKMRTRITTFQDQQNILKSQNSIASALGLAEIDEQLEIEAQALDDSKEGMWRQLSPYSNQSPMSEANLNIGSKTISKTATKEIFSLHESQGETNTGRVQLFESPPPETNLTIRSLSINSHTDPKHVIFYEAREEEEVHQEQFSYSCASVPPAANREVCNATADPHTDSALSTPKTPIWKPKLHD